MVSTPAIRMSARDLIGAAVFLPPVFIAASWGDMGAWRAGQAFWLLLSLAALGVLGIRGELRAPDRYILGALACFWVAAIGATLRDSIAGDPVSATADWTRLAIFSLFIIAISMARPPSLGQFLSSGRPLAWIFVAIFTLYTIIDPQYFWGRLTFFGLHPNFGGEILFACALAFLTYQRAWRRLTAIIVVLVCLVLLQSRAALIGVVLAYGLTEAILFFRARYKEGYLITLNAVLIIFALFLIIFSQEIIQFLDNRIFLFSDPMRGIGTGLVGRIDTFEDAISIFMQYPFFGVGFGEAEPDSQTQASLIHNGYLLMLAEFGIFALLIFFLMIRSLINNINNSHIAAAFFIASLFVMLFAPRSINLNLFPFVFWLSMMRWRDP